MSISRLREWRRRRNKSGVEFVTTTPTANGNPIREVQCWRSASENVAQRFYFCFWHRGDRKPIEQAGEQDWNVSQLRGKHFADPSRRMRWKCNSIFAPQNKGNFRNQEMQTNFWTGIHLDPEGRNRRQIRVQIVSPAVKCSVRRKRNCFRNRVALPAGGSHIPGRRFARACSVNREIRRFCCTRRAEAEQAPVLERIRGDIDVGLGERKRTRLFSHA